MAKLKKEKSEVRVLAGRKSKRKGSNNERKLANAFRDWWGWGEWARTPASGGWATPKHREAFRTCGDIMTTATDFPFCVEAKKQEQWRLEQILSTDSKCKIFEWWDQTCKETPKGLIPLLVMARNGVEPIAVFSPGWFRRDFKLGEGAPCHEWDLHPHLWFDHGVLHAVDRPEMLQMMTLENFFKVSPTYFGRKEENVQHQSAPAEPTEAVGTANGT